MRVSTDSFFRVGVFNMNNRQADLFKLQSQLSTQRRVLTPSDDPVASSRSLDLTQATRQNDQYGENVSYADSSLSLAEANLQQVIGVIQGIQQLAVQSGNPVLTSSEKKMIAADIKGKYEELLGLANTTDGNGLYIFSGFKGDTKPFNEQAFGEVRYDGDSGQRAVQISPSRQIPVSDSGADVFVKIKNGNGTFSTRMALPDLPISTALGDGGPLQFQRDPAGGFVKSNYRVDWDGTNYTIVRNSDGASATFSPAALATPQIALGMTIQLNGNPPSQANLSKVVDMTLAGNAGTGVIGPGVVTDQVKWSTSIANGSNTQNYKVMMHSVPDPTFPNDASRNIVKYDIVDSQPVLADGVTPNPNFQRSLIDGYDYRLGTPVGARDDNPPGSPNAFPRTYVPGGDIELRQLPGESTPLIGGWDFGAKLSISGTPKDGDSFMMEPSTHEDLFSTIGGFTQALNKYADSEVSGAEFQNRLNSVISSFGNALNNILTVQANIGARLKEASSVKDTNTDLNVQYKQTLGKLNDLDFNKAISDFTLTQTYLDAARRSFSSVQNLSLFQYIGG